MVNWLRLFQEIADEIYRAATPIFGSEKAKKVMGSSAGGNTTKYIDLLAEDIVVNMLEVQDISCVLISEECGRRSIGQGGDSYVILDSIDGTTNATRSIPFTSTSIAHATGDQLSDIDVALVKDLYQAIEFTAIKGKGAFKDRTLLAPSTIDKLESAIIAVQLTPREKLPELMKCLGPILYQAHKIRNLGSTALEVCYVASGSLDAFIDLGGLTRTTDLAAGYLVLKEAGGIMATPTGDELNMPLKATARSPYISVANRALLSEISTRLTLV